MTNPSTTAHPSRPRTQRASVATAAALTLSLTVGFQTGCRPRDPWPQWTSYSHSFIDKQGRVIDKAAGDRTTSEGEAYAMFFSLAANDRTHFDSLLQWTEANMAEGDLTLHLPAWAWGKSPDGSWKVLDANTASDADLWMAYSLIQAGRLWNNPRYAKLGAIMAARIAQNEVVSIPGLGPTLLPGPKGFHPNDQTWILNPSYLPLPLLTCFATQMPDGPWNSVLASLQVILAEGSGAGYVMDWVSAGDNGVHPSLSPTELATGKTDGLVPLGSYDAIRVYLWLGMTDPATPGIRQLAAATYGMNRYLQSNVTPPRQVDATGRVIDPDAPIGFSAAVIPYLNYVGLKATEKQQADRLIAVQDPATGQYGHDATYYDQNLALFATGWSENIFRFDRNGNLILKWK